MYKDGSCPGIGIGIKIANVSVGPSVIDPNEGCCITRCAFLLTRIIPRARDKLKRPTNKSFHVFLFDDTEEKSDWFENEKDQDAIHKITLCKYLDPYNELPIDQSKVFVCGTSSVRDHGILQNEKCLKIILKEGSSVAPFKDNT